MNIFIIEHLRALRTGWSCLILAAGFDLAGAPGLTLEEAIRFALEGNPSLQASSARVDASAGRAYQAARWSNPELELAAEDWPVSGRGGFSNAKQTIGVAQTLPFPGKKSLDRRSGAAGVKFAQAQLAVRRTETVRDVKASFFRTMASERLVEVSRDLVAAAQSSAATARKRVDAGAAPYQEQLRAEVQLEQARSELAEMERDMAAARAVFANLIGRADLREAHLVGALAETPRPELMQTGNGRWLERHPSAAAARAGVAHAELERRRAALEPYPDVRLGVSGGRMGETDESIIQLGLSLPLPILDRGKGKQQETRAELRAAEAELAGVQQQLSREWVQARQRYETAVRQVGNYRERLLPRAEEALKLVRIGFEEGKFGFMDLIDTQRTTAEARLAYQQKLLEMNVAQAELEALLQPSTAQESTAK